MKRPPLHRIAASLAACLSLALGGCGVLGKKPAPGEAGTEAAGETTPADPKKKKKDAEAADAKKESAEETAAAGDTKEDAKKEKKEESKKPESRADTPAEPAPDPAAAEEFAGLPKGEAEFILACRALATGGKATMTGKDTFVFDTRELGSLGANTKSGSSRHQAMVAAIVAHAETLRSAGVELVIAPVPPKPVIYPDFLGTEPTVKDRRYDAYLQALYAGLNKAGVRVVDVTKTLRSNRLDKGAASFPRTGLTWSPAAAAAAARAVHGAVKRTAAARTIVRDKTIVARDSAISQNGETFKAKSVGWAQGDRLVPATVPKEGAAIVIIGDNHAAAHRTDGVNVSLADQLSLAFGTAVEARATPGLGWKTAATFTPANDSATKLVVWCFSAAEFLDPPPAPPTRQAAGAARRPASRTVPRLDPAPGSGLNLRENLDLEGRQD